MRRDNLKICCWWWLGWGLLLLLPAWAGAAEPVTAVRTAGRAVALTFDDGPNPKFTPAILQLLARYRARATFFVLGVHAAKYPELMAAINAGGHEIGNHTWDHPHLPHCSPLELARQVEQTDLLLASLGLPPSGLFRPPYSEVCAQENFYLKATKRRLILWTIDAGDYLGLSGLEIAARVLSQLQPGAIIVFHDSDEREQAERRPTITALELLLPFWQATGWDLVTISELLARREGPQGPNYRLIRSASPSGPPFPRQNP